MAASSTKTTTAQVADTGTDLDAPDAETREVNSTSRVQAGGGVAIMKQQFLPCPGEPALKCGIWHQIFDDHLLACGLESVAEPRKLACLRSSLGAEGYKICLELCPQRSTYADTIKLLQEGFSPKPSLIFARSQFNRRRQLAADRCIKFGTALRSLAGKCEYLDTIRDELISDRFVAGC